jgi:hypothetical protein
MKFHFLIRAAAAAALEREDLHAECEKGEKFLSGGEESF